MRISHSTRQAIALALSWLLVFNSFPAQAIAEVLDESGEPQIVLVDEPAEELAEESQDVLADTPEESQPEVSDSEEQSDVAGNAPEEQHAESNPEPQDHEAVPAPEGIDTQDEPAERPEVEAELENQATIFQQNGLYLVGFYGAAADDPEVAAEALEEAIEDAIAAEDEQIELEQEQTAADLAKELVEASETFEQDESEASQGGLAPMALEPQAESASSIEHPDYPRTGDGSDIESITIKWLPKGAQATQQTEDGPAARLYMEPGGDSEQLVQFQLDYALSGEHNYAPGDVTITIPAYIFYQRDNDKTSSIAEKRTAGAFLSPMLEAPSRRTDFNWQLFQNEEGEWQYVFTNTKAMSAATKGFIQFEINSLRPHTLIDMSITEPLQATIEVTTYRDNTLGLLSNVLDAQINTFQEVRDATKRVNTGSPRIVPRSDVVSFVGGEANLPAWVDEHYAGEQHFVIVNYYMYAYHTGNQPYTLTAFDQRTDVAETKGETTTELHDGFIINGTTEETKDFGVIQNGWYTPGTSSYSELRVAYPLSQFETDTDYYFSNRVDYTLTPLDEVDEPTEEFATARVRWSYSMPKWIEPIGHYNVFKWGNDSDYMSDYNAYGKPASQGAGSSRYRPELTTHGYNGTRDDLPTPYTQHLNGYFGVYPKALNELRDQEDIIIGYTMKSEGYLLPWIWGGSLAENPPATRVEANYGRRPVTMITEDTGLWVGAQERSRANFELTVHEDYEFVAIDFPKPTIGAIKAINVNEDGSFAAIYAEDGTFEYKPDYNDANIPPIVLELQMNGSDEWVEYATEDWSSGQCIITLADGTQLPAGQTTLDLPASTDNFRTRVTSGNAYIYYYVRPIVKILSTEKWDSYIEDAFIDSYNPAANVWNGVNMKAYEYDGDLGAGNVPAELKDIPSVAETDPELGDLIVDISKNGYDTLYGYTTDISVIPYKNAIFNRGRDISYEDRTATVHYSARIEERSVIPERDVYMGAIQDGVIQVETSGTWYDLLPAGMTPMLNTVSLVREGDTIKNIRTIANYKNSGRTLMIVDVKLTPQPTTYSDGPVDYYMDVPQITFDATYTFEAITDYGETLHNVIAFESGNDSMGTIPNYMGEPDDARSNNNIRTREATVDDLERDTMTDLNPNRDTPSFLYAGASTTISRLADARTSLHKEVSVNNDGWYSQGTYYGERETEARDVYEGGQYSYRIRMMSDEGTRTSNMIVYDSLENYFAGHGNDVVDFNLASEYASVADYEANHPEDEYDFVIIKPDGTERTGREQLEGDKVFGITAAPRWRGTLRSVDVSHLTGKGVDAVVYYSTEDDLILQVGNNSTGTINPQHTDLTDSSIWVRADEYTGSLSDVHAIAVDARYKTDGTPFVLEPLETAVIYLNMKAPQGEDAAGFIAADAHAYNNIYLDCISADADSTEEGDRLFIRQDYTKVGLVENNIEAKKVWDDDNDRDGLRPESAKLTLLQNGVKFDPQAQGLSGYDSFENPLVVTADDADEDGAWTGVFEHLPYCDDDGNPFRYTVVEEAADVPAGYTQTSTMSADGKTATVTNYHEPEKITVEGSKTWVGDTEAVRPSAIRVEFYADGTLSQSMTLRPDADGNWSYTFSNLPKYRDHGIEIEYSVKESATPAGSLDSYISTTEYGYDDGGEVKWVASRDEIPDGFAWNNQTRIVNTYHPFGDVEFSKQVTDATAVNEDLEFNFTFTITGTEGAPDFGEYDYTVYGEDGAELRTGTISTNGTEKLAGNQRIVIVELPQGSTVSAREEVPTGWSEISSRSHDVTVAPNKLTKDMFHNQYSTSTLVPLQVNKTLTGRPTMLNAQFRFTLSTDEEGIDVLRTASSRTDGTATFGALEYANADHGQTYTYYIHEVDRGRAGYIYDDSVYRVDVALEDNGDGTMASTVTYFQKDGDDWVEMDAQPTFNNAYEAKGQTTLRSWKQLEGRALTDGEFTFGLYNGNGARLQTKTSNAAGEVTWDPIVFTQDDLVDDEGNQVPSKVFYYAISENPGVDQTVNYSEEGHGYTVTVVDNGDGTLTCVQGLIDVTPAGDVTWDKASDEQKEELCWQYDFSYTGRISASGTPATSVSAVNPAANPAVVEDWLIKYGELLRQDIQWFNETGLGSISAYAVVDGQRTVAFDPFSPSWEDEMLDYWNGLVEQGVPNEHEVSLFMTFTNDGGSFCLHTYPIGSSKFEDHYEDAVSSYAQLPGTFLFVDKYSRIPPTFSSESGETLPVFTNTLKPGNLQLTKNIDPASQSGYDPAQTFKFRIELSNENGVAQVIHPEQTSLDLAPLSYTETEELGIDDLVESVPDTSNHYHATAEELAGNAYAIYDPSTYEFIFFRSEETFENDSTQTVTLSNGEVHTGTVYAGFEDTIPNVNRGIPYPTWVGRSYRGYPFLQGRYSSNNNSPSPVQESAKSVRFVDAIRPKTCAYWFSALKECETYDLAKLDTSQCTDMRFMFAMVGDSSVEIYADYKNSKVKSLDLSTFDTANVQFYAYMFECSTALQSLDLSSFDNRKCLSGYHSDWEYANFSNMFNGCTSLEWVDISSLNIPSSSYSAKGWTGDMFTNCPNLKTIYVGQGFADVSAAAEADSTWTSYMYTFHGNDALVGGAGTKYSEVYEQVIESDYTFHPQAITRAEYARIDRPTAGLPGFFTGVPAGNVKLVFHSNDSADNTIRKFGKAEGPSVMLPSCFFRFAYAIESWNTEPDGTGMRFELEQVVPAGTFQDGQKVDLYAQWEEADSFIQVDEGVYEVEIPAGSPLTISDLPAGTTYRIFEETPVGWVLVSQSNTSGVIEPLETAEASFTNLYEPGSTSVLLVAAKMLDGKPASTAGEFTFTLSEDGNVIQTKTNTAGGLVAFDPIKYTSAGVHTYTISEVAGNDENITYDSHAETVTVTLMRDESYNLNATVEYEDGDRAVFENYTNPGRLTVSKDVLGTDDAEKDFTFEVEFRDSRGRLTEDELYYYIVDADGNVVDQQGDGGNGADVGARINLMGALGDLAIGALDALLGTEEAWAAEEDVPTWNAWGTCEWGIDSENTLWIRPQNGADEGDFTSLPSGYTGAPWFSQRLSIEAVKVPEGRKINLIGSMQALFYECRNVSSLDMRPFDTSRVTSMAQMFNYMSLESINLDGFDTSSVTSMKSMFYGNSLSELDLSGFDTSKVVDFSGAFFQVGPVKELNVLGFNTSSAENMYYMFCGNNELTSLDLSSFDTSKVTTMQTMFSSCRSLQTVDLSSFDTSRVTNMSMMFDNCPALRTVYASDSFVTNAVTDSSYMFRAANALEGGNGTTFAEKQSVDKTYARIDREGQEGYFTQGGYNLDYRANDGTANRYRQKNAADQDVEIIDNPFVSPRAFLGWNTSPDGSGVQYSPDDVIPARTYVNGDTLTLYAQWEPTPLPGGRYSVRHWQQPPSLSNDHAEYALIETEVFTESVNAVEYPAVKAYSGFMQPEIQAVAVAEDGSTVVDYYYDRILYTVSFDGNGARAGRMESQEIIGGIPTALNANAFSLPGSIFTGWNTKVDGSGTRYSDGQPVTGLAGDGSEVTLYAQWINNETSVTPTEGKVVVTLKAGQTVVFPDLPAGTIYTVDEQAIPAGYSLLLANNEKGTISSGGTSEAIFTNAYAAEGAINLHARKVLDGATLAAGQFDFVLLDADDYVVATGSNDASGNVSFDLIEYTRGMLDFEVEAGRASYDAETGSWTVPYFVRELVPAQSDPAFDPTMIYDTEAHPITVTVTDLGNGRLEAIADYDASEEDELEPPVIENGFITGSLEVAKTLTGATDVTADTLFDFRLVLRDAEGNELTGEYPATLRQRIYRPAETESYSESVEEREGSLENAQREDKQVELIIHDDERTEVQSMGVAYSHTQNISDDGVKSSDYGNYWNDAYIRGTGRTSANSQAHVVTIPGANRLHVTIISGGESTNWDWACMWEGNHPSYTASSDYGSSLTGKLGGTQNTVEHDVDGDTVTFSFRSDSSYSGNGYGYYAVVEGFKDVHISEHYVEPLVSSIIRDMQRYIENVRAVERIKTREISPATGYVEAAVSSGDVISLMDGESFVVENLPIGCTYELVELPKAGFTQTSAEGATGTLSAAAPDGSAHIVNNYQAYGEVGVAVRKALTGANLKADQFTFELLDADGAFIASASNDASGRVDFGTIGFTEADAGKTFTYYVVELNDGDPGYTYAESAFAVNIAVIDNGDGTLSFDITYDDEAQQIENLYAATGEVILTGTKKLEGRVLKDGQFSFEVLDSEGNAVSTGTNNADGRIEFMPIPYTIDDLYDEESESYLESREFSYTVVEKDTGEAGYTFDGTVHEVTVTIADNGDGTIACSVSPEDFSPEFTNGYDASGTAQISASKQLEGRTLEADEFEFELVDDKGKVLQTVKNAADGSIAFEPLEYALEDAGKTFSYSVREVKGALEDVEYDESVKAVTVSVADRGDGTLACTVAFKDGDSVFKNTYTPPEEPPTPEPPTPEPPTPEPPTPEPPTPEPPTPTPPAPEPPKPETPSTGDATPAALAAGLALIGGAALLVSRGLRRRRS